MHNKHFPVTGLQSGMLFCKIFHVTFGLFEAPISFQKCVDSVVEFSWLWFSMLSLCLQNLFLKLLANPTYVCFSPFLFSTVAWYMTPFWLQAPGRGHSLFLLAMQLQEGVGLFFLAAFLLFLRILLLCLLTWDFILGRHLYPTFTVCLLMTERSGCPGGKCSSINFKNSFPTFVAIFTL